MKKCYQCSQDVSEMQAKENGYRIEDLVAEDDGFAEALPVHCRPGEGESLANGAIVLCTPCIEKALDEARCPWVVMDGKDSKLKCTRCGDSYKPTLPIDVRLFCALTKQYVKNHRGCVEPQPCAKCSGSKPLDTNGKCVDCSDRLDAPQATGIPEVGRRDDPKYQVKGQMSVDLEREPEVKPRGVRKFVCEVCEQEFPQTNELLKHECSGPNHEFVTDVDMVKLAGLTEKDVDLFCFRQKVDSRGRKYCGRPRREHTKGATT